MWTCEWQHRHSICKKLPFLEWLQLYHRNHPSNSKFDLISRYGTKWNKRGGMKIVGNFNVKPNIIIICLVNVDGRMKYVLGLKNSFYFIGMVLFSNSWILSFESSLKLLRCLPVTPPTFLTWSSLHTWQ